ncbi:MAG: hypothetical protein M0C28_26560 [Candidatus Moduliflexus flocculans]|nr:hypothetical protein [Candidatus Moduliflexus flocculans]
MLIQRKSYYEEVRRSSGWRGRLESPAFLRPDGYYEAEMGSARAALPQFLELVAPESLLEANSGRSTWKPCGRTRSPDGPSTSIPAISRRPR